MIYERGTDYVLGTRERHLEAILQSSLRQIILIHNFPRTLIQVTLQITSTPENDTTWSKLVQASSVSFSYSCSLFNLLMIAQNLPLLPALLQTSILTLLSASIPLSMTITSIILALKNTETGTAITENPTPVECQDAASVHVLTFTSHGELLVSESEGNFDMDEWEEIYEHAKGVCCKSHGSGEDDIMHGDGLENEAKSNLTMFLKSTVQEKVATDLHWKG